MSSIPRIHDLAGLQEAMGVIVGLLDEGKPSECIRAAEACTGNEALVTHAKAWAYAEAGGHANDLGAVEHAAELWDMFATLAPPSPDLDLNMATTADAEFGVVLRTDGRLAALERKRDRLHFARATYQALGSNDKSSDDVRLRALTNLGNSFDHMGRDLEAIAAYEAATVIDPEFGMAQGNLGVALLGVAPHAPGHEVALAQQAAHALDLAIANPASILRASGPPALARFKADRQRIEVPPGTGHGHGTGEWRDPYLRWCRESGLFLHVSPSCLNPEDVHLDPLFFSFIAGGPSDEDLSRVNLLVDSFGAIKQDFVSARYLAWLVIADESPIVEEASRVSARTAYLDSLSYARWGVRTGMTLQAFAAAINVLDKVASFTHLYLSTGRLRDVSFRAFWHGRNKAATMDEEIAAELAEGSVNRGLLALCDLSCDLEIDGPLNQLVERRHAATHRFLVAHEFEIDEDRAPKGDWLERVEISEIIGGLIDQLRTARAAIIYLCRTVEIREGRSTRDVDGPTASIPIWEATTEDGWLREDCAEG